MVRSLLALFLAMAVASAGVAHAQGADNALVKDAIAAERRGDDDTAIRLYTRALDAGGLSAAVATVAHNNRGGLYRRKGRHEDALGDFTAAIVLEPQESAFYDNRGNVHLDGGELDDAIADFDAAVRLAPGFVDAYLDRARARFMAGQYAAAARDYEESFSLRPTQAFTLLWLHLARARAGVDDAEAFARNAAKLDLKTWPGPIVAYFLGRLDGDQLLAAAGIGSADVQYRRSCSALFFLGEGALVKGDAARAAALLGKARAFCRADEPEHAVAAAELQHLAKGEESNKATEEKRSEAKKEPALAAIAPGGTAASPILQRDVARVMVVADYALAKDCNQRKVVDTAVIEGQPGTSSWTERWTLDRCGSLVAYRVSYSPHPQGGTDFAVRLEK